MQQLSIGGKDYHTEDHVVGYYTTGDRMKAWGRIGAFWGGLWGLLFGAAFFMIPGIGPVVMSRASKGSCPRRVETLELQVQRLPQQLDHKTSDLERYLYLIQLLEHNETLFYRVVMADLARLLPITYDPTVGEACLKFGHIFRRPRDLYLAITQR